MIISEASSPLDDGKFTEGVSPAAESNGLQRKGNEKQLLRQALQVQALLLSSPSFICSLYSNSPFSEQLLFLSCFLYYITTIYCLRFLSFLLWSQCTQFQLAYFFHLAVRQTYSLFCNLLFDKLNELQLFQAFSKVFDISLVTFDLGVVNSFHFF